MLDRRTLTTRFCAAIGVYALLGGGGSSALAAADSVAAKRWLDEHRQITGDLKAGGLSLLGWQSAVERLAHKVDLAELLAQTDFERLKASFDYKDGMPSKRMVRFPKEPGAPGLSYGLAFFGFRRGHVITPHGHRNMVSAHMVAAGRFRVRNFDRLGDEPDALIIRPTVDARIGRGQVSTMSSHRNNIHWFVAEEDGSATLDVIVDAIDPKQEPYKIDLVDPAGGQPLGDGSIRAPLIDWDASVAKYA